MTFLASSFFLATGLALAVLVSLYPVLLLPALAVLCAKARRAHTQRHRGFKENVGNNFLSYWSDSEERRLISNCSVEYLCSFIGSSDLVVLGDACSWYIYQLSACRLRFQFLGPGLWDIVSSMDKRFGEIITLKVSDTLSSSGRLLVPDLTPNIGLWWYFFIEIFDHFRDFFLLAFNVHAACYTLPLTIKYQCVTMTAISALFCFSH